MEMIFPLAILIFSVILHEVAHGYMANYLGDPTARLQGRLTLNPISHIDPIGTVFLPLIQIIATGKVWIGYAKPVPYNPYNLPGKYDEGLVAFAGPGTNILIAAIFGLAIRFAGFAMPTDLIPALLNIVFINLSLATINLIPIPPIDGSKVLSSFLEFVAPPLARGYSAFRSSFERIGILPGIIILLAVISLFQQQFYAFLLMLASLLTGIPL